MSVVQINGRPQAVEPGTTILALIESRGLCSDWVVVEHNGDALQRLRFPEVRLEEGDRLEIVRAVAGGSR